MNNSENTFMSNQEPRTTLWNLTTGNAFLLLFFSGQLCGLATSALIKLITASAEYPDLSPHLKIIQTAAFTPGGICEIGLIILILGKSKKPGKFTGACLRATPYMAIAFIAMTWAALVAMNFWPEATQPQRGESSEPGVQPRVSNP